MEATTAQALAELNRRFYEGQTASSFDATRAHPWPGFSRIVEHLPPGDVQRVLDVGCGNGRLATFLAGAVTGQLHYHGVDGSVALVASAREATRAVCPRASFTHVDLLDAPDTLPRGAFSCIAAIAVLHHVPGRKRRAALVRALAERLSPGGILVLTAWRFDRIARVQPRRIPWADGIAAGELRIDPDDLEPGDELVAWGGGTQALRYCHLLDDARFTQLIDDSALACVERFASDGTGADHNEYAILRRDLVPPG